MQTIEQTKNESTKTFDSKTPLSEVKHLLGVDTISRKKGMIIVRAQYFYRMGKSTETYVNRVKQMCPSAIIIDSGDNWASFRGGASVARSSHWYVKFYIPDGSGKAGVGETSIFWNNLYWKNQEEILGEGFGMTRWDKLTSEQQQTVVEHYNKSLQEFVELFS